jgi:hypothetical protein
MKEGKFKMKKFDFSGWATRNDIECSDGRTIIKDAFKHNDGKIVPLVWNHNHDNPDNILGHALLENREEGVYVYGSFNENERSLNAKQLLKHGDIVALSICANQLKHQGANVLYGVIQEVSLVLAGANPGAFIDTVLVHGEESDEEAIIYTGEDVTVEYTQEEQTTVNDGTLTHSDDTQAKTDSKNTHNKEEGETKMTNEDKTVQEIFDTLNEEQKTVIYAMIGQALEDAGDNDNEGDNNMKHNVFDNDNTNEAVLNHAAVELMIKDGKRLGSLKEGFLAHAEEYGIQNIDWLFPEAQSLNNPPAFVKRNPGGWVQKVMSGVHHTPFSRIKSVFADITADEARAKGYLKGNLKMEEVFGLLKRTTEPTTVYKKQKLDRDDVIDIVDFDVVAWLKAEMRGMLDEELARSIIFSDKRNNLNPDKISEDKIRPVVSDSDFYSIKKTVDPAQGEKLAHAIITSAVKAQDDYQGSGNLTAFFKNSIVSDMLLLEDSQGHRLYKNISELALALGVNTIEKVPASVVPTDCYGVILDLDDYNVGADKGGSVNMFDDFDIDYNQQKYLIETRASGALIKPYSAIVLKVKPVS